MGYFAVTSSMRSLRWGMLHQAPRGHWGEMTMKGKSGRVRTIFGGPWISTSLRSSPRSPAPWRKRIAGQRFALSVSAPGGRWTR